jgi:hypothetical protein
VQLFSIYNIIREDLYLRDRLMNQQLQAINDLRT